LIFVSFYGKLDNSLNRRNFKVILNGITKIKRSKRIMQKLFRLTALLIAATLVVWVVGCGDDDEEDGVDGEPVATVDTITPADGTTVTANTPIEVTFDNGVKDCTIAGKAATLTDDDKTATVDDAGLTVGEQTVNIAWTNKDDSAGEGATVTYTVEEADATPPALDSSTPADDASDVVPDDVNTDGIVLEFDEAIDTQALELQVEGTAKDWTGSIDGSTVTLLPLAGATLGYETDYTVAGTVADAAGNETDVEVAFTTMVKPE